MADRGAYAARLMQEEEWRLLVKTAQQRFLQAAERHRHALEHYKNLPTPNSDGTRAVLRAAKVEAAALREYSKVLRIFTALATNGKQPPPE